ncbi:MAG: hypothetical protein NXH75_10705 [Halobacteriovoraceae bacterium]|nr:hypothetical protein [Halobacteriovoraceae bacterium]
MKLNISLSIFLSIFLFSSPSFGSREKRELVEKNNLCGNRGLTLKNVNYSLTFKGERRSSSEILGFYKNTFFVGTHFIVNRNSKTFTNETLLNPNGIGEISESEIGEFEVVDSFKSEAFFTSTKKLPFGFELQCTNSIKVKRWSDFIAGAEEKELVESLSENGCFKANLPFIVSDQKVYSCNNFFTKSRVISFYFREDRFKTRILTLTFSELVDSFGFIQKRVMASEVKKSLEEIASIIERLP